MRWECHGACEEVRGTSVDSLLPPLRRGVGFTKLELRFAWQSLLPTESSHQSWYPLVFLPCQVHREAETDRDRKIDRHTKGDRQRLTNRKIDKQMGRERGREGEERWGEKVRERAHVCSHTSLPALGLILQ